MFVKLLFRSRGRKQIIDAIVDEICSEGRHYPAAR
jgi:hypothetical protein